MCLSRIKNGNQSSMHTQVKTKPSINFKVIKGIKFGSLVQVVRNVFLNFDIDEATMAVAAERQAPKMLTN